MWHNRRSLLNFLTLQYTKQAYWNSCFFLKSNFFPNKSYYLLISGDWTCQEVRQKKNFDNLILSIFKLTSKCKSFFSMLSLSPLFFLGLTIGRLFHDAKTPKGCSTSFTQKQSFHQKKTLAHLHHPVKHIKVAHYTA